MFTLAGWGMWVDMGGVATISPFKDTIVLFLMALIYFFHMTLNIVCTTSILDVDFTSSLLMLFEFLLEN